MFKCSSPIKLHSHTSRDYFYRLPLEGNHFKRIVPLAALDSSAIPQNDRESVIENGSEQSTHEVCAALDSSAKPQNDTHFVCLLLPTYLIKR